MLLRRLGAHRRRIRDRGTGTVRSEALVVEIGRTRSRARGLGTQTQGPRGAQSVGENRAAYASNVQLDIMARLATSLEFV